MVPTLYFCRLEAYARIAHCSRAGPTGQRYTMALPDPDTYQDLNSDYSFPGSSSNEIITHLSKFNKSIEFKAKNLYYDRFTKYLRTTEYNSLWYMYVRGFIRAEMSNYIVYAINIKTGQNGSVLKCQYECGTGMRPFAHCKQ